MIKDFKRRSNMVKNAIFEQNLENAINGTDFGKKCYNFILSTLDEDSRRIITADYIQRESTYWYYSYYSKSTYFRLKNIALDKFIEQMYSD